MMNKIQEAIAKLEAKPELDALGEKMLEMLRQKQEELGEDPTEEEVKEGMHQVLKEHLMFALRQKMMSRRDSDDNEDDEDGEDSDESAEAREEDICVIREVFRDMDLHFRDYPHQKGVHAFELGVREDGKRLNLRVYLDAEADICRIDALYPFTADQIFAYPLCEMLLKESYPRRYGCSAV